MNHLRKIILTLSTSALSVLAPSLFAADMPDPTSENFCVEAQKILANTEIEGTNEIFDNMPAYRKSKPKPDPLMIYQVVTYDEVGAIVVSCKVKTVDHLQEVYGEETAGPQGSCPTITGMLRDQAVNELMAEGNDEAASAASAFVIDNTEPYLKGVDYLSDFQPLYKGDDGAIHIASPGLQVDWNHWMSWIMPDDFVGQTYCHLATADYIKRIAKGEVEPGQTITTEDDAPTTPQGS